MRIVRANARMGFGLFAVLWLVPLLGCSQEAPPVEEQIRPVRYETIYTAGGGRSRSFSGVAKAGLESRLSFRVNGTIQKLNVRVGETVPARFVIAELDPTDYRLAVEEAQASLRRQEAQLRNNRANYSRVEGLYENRNASLSDLEAARAQYETSEAAVAADEKNLEMAQTRLTYTKLYAPVAGAIASVDPEVNENVTQGEVIAVLTSGAQAEVEVSVPENLIGGINEGDKVTCSFDAIQGKVYTATATEVAVSSTQSGSAFPVTVRLDEEDDEIRPGMSAEVTFRFGASDTRERIYVPASSVGEDNHGRFAFVIADLQDDTGVARRVEVQTGELTRSGLEILDGINDGDLLITAGVTKLVDGTAVRLLQPLESDG